MTKSKKRISEYGEVFTSEREVKAMLNLVGHETKRIDARFFEPACGDGNFLIDVLRRKLKIVEEQYSKNQSDFEKYSFLAVTSIYGVDILEDNVEACRLRLLKHFEKTYLGLYTKINEELLIAISFVLSLNIAYGNALTLKLPNSEKPVVFSEWSFTTRNLVKRTDYTLSNLLAYQPFEEESLFSDMGDKAFIPHALKKHKLVNFLNVHHA